MADENEGSTESGAAKPATGGTARKARGQASAPRKANGQAQSESNDTPARRGRPKADAAAKTPAKTRGRKSEAKPNAAPKKRGRKAAEPTGVAAATQRVQSAASTVRRSVSQRAAKVADVGRANAPSRGTLLGVAAVAASVAAGVTAFFNRRQIAELSGDVADTVRKKIEGDGDQPKVPPSAT